VPELPISRRHFLAIIPASVALAACAPAAAGSTANVRDFGAKGDGSTDDSAAIGKAVASLKSGDVLQFPSGSYRFAQRNPTGGAAIRIDGLSNVSIEFDTGAELLMDNLDGGGAGTSHGILIRGPVSHITLRNVTVRWASQPATRSLGDGIRVVGYPSDAQTVAAGWTASAGPASGISLSDCVIRSAPQAGVIMMGVSDITVSNLRVQDTMADGLHFNACRRANITGYSATNTGDDGLALVTYFTDAFGFDSGAATFSFPDLNDWSNGDFTVANVDVSGGQANGVRLAGANRVSLSGVTVRGTKSGAGVIVDSAAVGSSGVDWHYVAARGVHLDQVMVDGSETGINLLARPSGADERFSRFDVNVAGATIHNCTGWSVLAESVTDQPATGFRLDNCTVEAPSTSDDTGVVGLQTTQGMSLGTVSIQSGQPMVAFSASDSRQFTVDHLAVTITGPGNDPDSAGPCAQFQASDGTVTWASVSWPQAPASWVPIQIANGPGGCSDDSASTGAAVQITTVTVDPASVTQHLQTC
jgi:hypothetical protein